MRCPQNNGCAKFQRRHPGSRRREEIASEKPEAGRRILSREWEPEGDKQQVAAGQRLPGGGPAGFPHVVVDVCFLGQVELVGFGLEQKLPGTGHLYGFESWSLVWI